MKVKQAKIILNALCAGISNLQTLEAITMAMNAFDEINRLKDENEGLVNGQKMLKQALERKTAELEKYKMVNDLSELSDKNTRLLIERLSLEVESKSAVMETMARCIEIQEKEIERLNVGLDSAMKFHSESASERDSAKAEIEHLKKLLAESEAKYNEAAKRFYKHGVKDFQKKLKDNMNNVAKVEIGERSYYLIGLDFVDTVAKELAGETK